MIQPQNYELEQSKYKSEIKSLFASFEVCSSPKGAQLLVNTVN